MSKAVLIPLCTLLFAGTAFLLSAQPVSTTEAAVQEAVRREAARIELRQKLEKARAAEQRDDLVTAAKLYDDAWSLVESVGPSSEPEARLTIAGLSQVRMQLANEARHQGNFRAAEVQVKDVLRVNPNDPAAIAFESENSKMMEAQRGKVPGPAMQEQAKAIGNDKIQAATLVQDARLLYELGKLNEADIKLRQALKIDPSNENAVYYAKLVEQARAREAMGKKDVDDEKRLVQVEQAWEDQLKRELLPIPNPMARTNLVYTSKSRQAILTKLDRIRLDTVLYDSLPLSEVVRSLSEQIKQRDPEKRGVNILINPSQETIAATPVIPLTGGGPGAPMGMGAPFQPVPRGVPAAAGFDAATGLPTATTPTETIDINSVTIKINPALSDVRLADVLDAIVTVADHPIRYSILDYAIVFSLKGPETPELHFRTFKVDPNTFMQGLQAVGSLDISTLISTTSGSGGSSGGGSTSGGSGGQSGQQGGSPVPRVFVSGGGTSGGGGGGIGGGGGGGAGGTSGQTGGGLLFVTTTNNTDLVQNAVINFFRTVGVDLTPQNGKNVFFNDREGTLMVRATTQELDIIEAAIQTLNIAPPEITIKAKFVEVTQNDSKQLGFDWYLGNFLMGNGAVGVQGGTAPSYSGQSSAANPLGVFPGTYGTTPGPTPTTYNTTTLPSSSDQLLTGGLRNSGGPAIATLTGILTDPQFRVVLHALEQRDGADLLNEGQVTTLSGRQAQIQVVDLQYIVTGTGVNSATGGSVGGSTVGNVTTTPAQSVVPSTTMVPLGPTLDVIPYVSADGYTIQMTIIPTIIEFLQYDNPGPFLVQAQIGNGTPLVAQLPLPHFRVRQVTTSAIVWDGQTVVLGGLISENVSRIKDEVPILGDLPLVGRLFRSESNISQKKNLVIFVTPTIIDPAGNRVHTDEELPFAQSLVPPQRPESATP